MGGKPLRHGRLKNLSDMGGEGEAWHVCIHRCLEGGSNSGDDSILLPTLGEEQEAVNRSSFCRFVLQTIARHFMRFKGAKYSPIEDWFREGFVDLRQGAHQVLKGHKYLGKSWTLISKLAKHYQTWGIHWWDELLLNELFLHFWSCSSRPWNSWDTCPVVVSTPANRHHIAENFNFKKKLAETKSKLFVLDNELNLRCICPQLHHVCFQEATTNHEENLMDISLQIYLNRWQLSHLILITDVAIR